MTQHQFKQLVLLSGLIVGLVSACGDSSSSSGCAGDGGTDAACAASKADGGQQPSSADGGAIDANLSEAGSAVDAAHPVDAPLGNEAGEPMDAHHTGEAGRVLDGSSGEAGKPVDTGTPPPDGSHDAGHDSRVAAG